MEKFYFDSGGNRRAEFGIQIRIEVTFCGGHLWSFLSLTFVSHYWRSQNGYSCYTTQETGSGAVPKVIITIFVICGNS